MEIGSVTSAASTGRCGSSSNGGPPRKNSPTRWHGSVRRATGVRLAELAGIRYDPDDPGRNDLDLQGREIRILGQGGKGRIATATIEPQPPTTREKS
jgi:hypothetical protein